MVVLRFFRDVPYRLSRVNKAHLLFSGAIAFVLLGEVHTFWMGDYREFDVFLAIDYRLQIQWIIRDITAMLQTSLLAFMLYIYIRKRDFLKKVMLAVFLYTLIDVIFYFINLKSAAYALVYFVISGILLIFNHRMEQKPKP
jgi:hypothetical protein